MLTLVCLLTLLGADDATPLAPPEVFPTEMGAEGFAESGDVKIHYVTKGSGPLVVMIHGFPDYWYSWRHQIPALAEKYQTVAIDQRGYNTSGQPTGLENYTLDKLTEDIAAVVKHFKRDKAIVVGHDWGGLVAWSTAMKHPEMVDRLVIVNLPHPRGLQRELANNPEQQKNSQYARTFQSADPSKMKAEMFLFAHKFETPEVRKAYKSAFARSSVEGMLNYYKVNYPKEPYTESQQDFPPVKCPTLIFHGLGDKALLPGALAGTWDWVDADMTLVTLPKTGHWAHWERHEKVTRTMLDWLAD